VAHGAPSQMVESTDPISSRFFHAYRDRLREGRAVP
jgi:hypothetical protein